MGTHKGSKGGFKGDSHSHTRKEGAATQTHQTRQTGEHSMVRCSPNKKALKARNKQAKQEKFSATVREAKTFNAQLKQRKENSGNN